MKKKLTAIIVTGFVSILMMSPASASVSISLSKTTAGPGETVAITGTAEPDTSIVIKITDGSGNIVFFDAAGTGAGGDYAADFVVPGDMAPISLTVTAGSGEDVAVEEITVTSAGAANEEAQDMSASGSDSGSGGVLSLLLWAAGGLILLGAAAYVTTVMIKKKRQGNPA